MLRFRDIPISGKLLLAFGILMLLASAIAAVSYFSLKNILVVHSLVGQSDHIESTLLQMNIVEKKFILFDARDSSEQSYFKTGYSENVKLHRTYYNEIITQINKLIKNPMMIKENMAEVLNEAKTNIELYNKYFEQFVELIKKAGFKEWGLEGKLRDAIHSVEISPVAYDAAAMLMLRRNEKDYFLRKDLQYQKKLHENVDIFKSSISKSQTISESDKQKLINLINAYRTVFDQVVEVDKQIGFTANQGIMLKMATTYQKIQPLLSTVTRAMYMKQESAYQETSITLLLLFLTTLTVGSILTLLMTSIIAKPIRKINVAAKEFGMGNLNVVFNVDAKDEVGQLAETFQNLINRTQVLANVATKIGEGYFDTPIQARSKEDTLGLALKKMQENLQALYTENKNQIWIKTQIANIVNLSQGINNLQDLMQRIITELAVLLKAGYGVFYSVTDGESEENQKKLVLLGSYAYKKRKNISNSFKFGEGLVGQCALEKKPIILTEVPSDYIHITSGLGEQVPLNVIVIPILHEEKILGVIELGSFYLFNNEEQDLLDGIANNLGIIMSNIASHQKTEDLLKESQVLSEELQTQQEELRVTNEELEEKTQILKESENKLQVQSEELQLSNQELEEKSEHLTKQNLAIERQNKAIEKARSELEQQTKDLAMASKYKSEFLANMSHELRTPLNSLLILSKNLHDNKEKNLTAKQVESAAVIYSAGKELLTLINDILDLSKVEAGRLQIEITSVSVKRICDTLKSQFEPLAKDKKIDFIIDIAPDVPSTINTDEQRISQIIKNLLSNAFKFTSLGSVTLKMTKANKDFKFKNTQSDSNNVLSLSVIDTGIGIPKDKQEAIFEAFQQADGSTSRTYGGTGLGLAISRALAALLGGEISLTSEEKKGSIFTLYLPMDFSESKVNQVSSSVENKKPVAPIIINEKVNEVIPNYIPDDREKLPSTSKSVLIIDDDKSFAKILIDEAKKKNYLCLAAGDGNSGFNMAKVYQPSAIILDLGLPDMDGTQVLDKLKYDLKTRHIPVHVVSAKDETPEVRQKGAIGYLAKPADAEAFSLVLNKIETITENAIKHVLLILDDPQEQADIIKLISNEHIKIECVATAESAKEHLRKQLYDCIVLELNLPDQSGFDLLKSMKQEKIDLPPIVIYTDRELTEQEYDTLQQYAASIIIKGANSSDRLLDEISLFLHSVETDLPEEQKKKIQNLHNPDKILLGKRILLVDDDMRNIFALSSVFEEEGLEVFIAANGKAALDKLAEIENINIVLMDIMMPVMDGYEAIKKIRENKQFHNLPIIALTAKAMSDDKEKCLKAGANDYITKPVDVGQLLSLLKIWLSK